MLVFRIALFSGELLVRQTLKMEDQKYKLRDALSIDAAEVAKIYNYYIANTIITFEEDAVSVDLQEIYK